MSKRETKNYRAGSMTFCSYCHSSLYPYDEFDDYAGYSRSYYKCDCDKAIIEDKMNDEIDGAYKEIEIIKARYQDKLDYNSEEIEKNIFLQELEELKDRYGFDENGNKIQVDDEEFEYVK